MLRGHSFSFPEAPDGVMHDLFPQLMILMLEEDDSGPSCPVDDDGGHTIKADSLLEGCSCVAVSWLRGRGQSPPARWTPMVGIDLCYLLVMHLLAPREL